MISTKEYIGVLKAASLSFKYIKLEFPDDFFEGLNRLRISSKKYIKELEYWTTYPNADLTEARMHGKDIIETCKELGITQSFFPLNKQRREDKTFVQYKYQNVNITDIIVI